MMTYRVIEVPYPQLEATLNKEAGEGWKLESIPMTGAVQSRLAGAPGPVPMLVCVFSSNMTHCTDLLE